jgi:HD-like signal output (HDOD) protein
MMLGGEKNFARWIRIPADFSQGMHLMMNFLKRFFGFAALVAEKSPAPPVQSEITAYPKTILLEQFNSSPWQAQMDVNAKFFKYCFDTVDADDATDAPPESIENPHEAIETAIIHALEELCQSELAGSNLVPRVPFIVPQILKSLRDEHASNSELAFHIAKDLVLVSELLHEVNSAHFNPTQKIISLDKAVQLLGQNGLRLIVAKVACRPIFNIQSGELSKAITPILWQHAEKCAFACRALARERKQNHFAGFLAGLVQNVGLVVASRIVDYICADGVRPTSIKFEQALLAKARELTFLIAEEWEFPDAVLIPLKDQMRRTEELSDLRLSLRQADQLSKIHLLVKANLIEQDDPLLLLDQDTKIMACYQEMLATKE